MRVFYANPEHLFCYFGGKTRKSPKSYPQLTVENEVNVDNFSLHERIFDFIGD